MKNILPAPDFNLPNAVLNLRPELVLVTTAYTTGGVMLRLAARMAQLGSLTVLDGGNTFNLYPVAQALRCRVQDARPQLAGIQLARVFSCYQMASLTSQVRRSPTPAGAVLVMDYLSTFCDEAVPLANRRRLFEACTADLQFLSRRVPVIVWVRLRLSVLDTMKPFVRRLQSLAGQTWQADQPAPQEVQLALW